ncbi:uncharacterized protein [Pyxicephalus adspersus]|uniref:uncharacterized protein n=1 Tax=Pyxicephalus adspersus TaxID=30357 RepID=UPI003B59C782
MDMFHGMEVGAEVELNDGSSALEDHILIKLENKRDLPLWHHLPYFDDSSSDESLVEQYVNSLSPEVKTLEMQSPDTDIKNRVVENDELEKSLLSTTGTQPGLFYINGEQREDHSLVLNNAYSKDLLAQALSIAPYLEESSISCTEALSSSNFSQVQPYSTGVHTETTLSCGQDPRESVGKYSYYDTQKHCNKSVNPLGRSFKCQRCGRQFGRLYNLENHVCIKMALGGTQQNSNNIETMNRLEKMCAEAQKELQSLQGQYGKEVEDINPGSSEILTWRQEPFLGSGRVLQESKRDVSCGHHECESGSTCRQAFCISSNDTSQNLTAFENSFVVNLTNCSPIFPEANKEQDSARQTEGIHPQLGKINGEWTNLNHHLSFQTSEENPADTTNTSHNATKIYKCQECDKVYNKRCSIANHMRWHVKEKNLISSMVSKLVEPSTGSQEYYGTTPRVSTPLLGLKNVDCAISTQTFTCEYCGKVFNKHCSYTTHTLWHLKSQEPVTVIEGTNQETRKSDTACTSPVKIFTCQYCEKVFNKRCAFLSHSRWHVKEQEFQKEVIAEAQRALINEEHLQDFDIKNPLDHDIAFDGDLNKGMSGTWVDDGKVQGYCRLVSQLSLNEQHSISLCDQVVKKCAEHIEVKRNPQTSLESVFELAVGAEEVHEILLNKAGLVIQKAEYYGIAEEVVEDVAQVSETKLKSEESLKLQLEPAEKQVFGTYSEPAEKKVGRPQAEPSGKPYSLPSLPSKLVAQCLGRSKPPHRCRDCGVRFYQSWRVKHHRLKDFRKKSTLKKHHCDCGRMPVGSLHFLLHQLQHLGETDFLCAVCNKLLHGYRQLQAHSWVHPLASQFQCKCGTRFTNLSKYLWHSLKNKAKSKPKLRLTGCPETLV